MNVCLLKIDSLLPNLNKSVQLRLNLSFSQPCFQDILICRHFVCLFTKSRIFPRFEQLISVLIVSSIVYSGVSAYSADYKVQADQ